MNRSQLAEVMQDLCRDEDEPVAMVLAMFCAVAESEMDENEISDCDELAARALKKAGGSFEKAMGAVSMALVGLARYADDQVDDAVVSTTAPILGFQGPYRFLSNFVGQVTTADGRVWKTAEHAYQAAKSVRPEDRDRIQKCPTPAAAKAAGRLVSLRRHWRLVCRDFMTDIVRRKFTQNPGLREKLLATGDRELAEVNTWGDRYWGVYNGEGENHLGKILMKIREELRSR